MSDEDGRFEDTVKNLLKMPHKPHKPAKASEDVPPKKADKNEGDK